MIDLTQARYLSGAASGFLFTAEQTEQVRKLLREMADEIVSLRGDLNEARMRDEITRLEKKVAHLTATIQKLVGLETGSHFRCSGCDEIYEKPCAEVVEIIPGEYSRYCSDCIKDGGQ